MASIRRSCILLGVASLLVALASPTRSRAADRDVQVRLVTFNIRYGTADDGPNHWSLRRELVFTTLRESDADFIGLQEALPFQIEEIAAQLPEHRVLYRTREADPTQGEACAVFYRSDRWELDRHQHGTFWLSETPEVAGSESWGAALPRIATWGRFDHRETGARLFLFNTHFDHRSELARERSAELLRERAAAEAGDAPLVVLGDFNAGEASTPLALLQRPTASGLELVDSFRSVHPDATAVATFNAWGARVDGDKIDAILVSSGTEVVAAEIVRRRFEGRPPSDHEPVTATLALRLERTVIEVTDLGECRSCAGAIVRGLARVAGVLRAELAAGAPEVLVTTWAGRGPGSRRLRDAVRDAGYTPGEVRAVGSVRD